MTSIALKALLNWLLILKLNMGIPGITLSTSFVTLFNAVFLGMFINKKVRLEYRELFVNLMKMILAGILTFILGLFLCRCFPETSTMMLKMIKIFAIIFITTIIYVVLNILFKMNYAKELVYRLRK